MKMIFVSGLKEVDRDTIVDLAIKNSGSKNFRHVDIEASGDLHEELAKAPNMPTAKQIVRTYYTDLEKNMVQGIRGKEEDLMVTGYMTVRNPKIGYVNCLPSDFFTVFKPDMIILLEKKGIEEDLEEHQRINRHFGSNYAIMCNSSLKIIKMSSDNMMDAVRELAGMIRM